MRIFYLFLCFICLCDLLHAQTVRIAYEGDPLTDKERRKIEQALQYEVEFYTQFGLPDTLNLQLTVFNKREDALIYLNKFNIHPPYNGEGDTVIFKLTEKTFFSRRFADRITYSCTELFHNPYKVMFAGPVWFHLHANRAYCCDKVKKVKSEHPELFVSPEKFLRMNSQEVLTKMDPKVNTLFQRTLFALIHKMGIQRIKEHLYLLDKIKV